MSKIFVPATSVDQWKRLLADPEKHWRVGFSARTLASCWQDADDLPVCVRAVFSSPGIEQFKGIELLLAIPEHQVPLPGGARPSQNDVWALARAGDELVSIAVEGKVSEPFGPTLEEWLRDASPGKTERLDFICELLGLSIWPPPHVRYQLLHRTASAVILARKFNAAHAVMLVHSFSPSDDWFDDYTNFLSLFGSTGSPNSLTPIIDAAGLSVYLGWVRGEERFLRT